jgi:hypothetical protein
MFDWILEKGFALIIVFVLVALGLLLFHVISNPCSSTDEMMTYYCRNEQVELCMKDERYTREECIELIGGGK